MAKKNGKRKNRFSGADNVYETKKYYVRQDVWSDSSGRCNVTKKYIRKSPKARSELVQMFGRVLRRG